METEKKQVPQNTGEQYLCALIKCADWVEDSFKELAESAKTIAALKELYLCACDGVLSEKAEEALKSNSPEEALRFLRYKHIQRLGQGDYESELSGIKKRTITMEQEIRQISNMVKHITSQVPSFDAMFPEMRGGEEGELIPELNNGKAEENDSRMEPNGDIEVDGDTKDGVLHKEWNKKTEKTAGIEEPISKEVQKKKGKMKWSIYNKKKKSISAFLEELIKEGYRKEQIDYLLGCLEEGMEIAAVRRFASPRLPVDVMQRLRMLEERKETNNGA